MNILVHFNMFCSMKQISMFEYFFENIIYQKMINSEGNHLENFSTVRKTNTLNKNIKT